VGSLPGQAEAGRGAPDAAPSADEIQMIEDRDYYPQLAGLFKRVVSSQEPEKPLLALATKCLQLGPHQGDLSVLGAPYDRVLMDDAGP
jgi:hypothetical protein